MVVCVLGLKHDVVESDDGRATALLVLNARPASLRALAAAPLVETVPPHHYHGVAVTSRIESQLVF